MVLKIIKESDNELKPICKIGKNYLVYNLKHHKQEIMCFCMNYKELIGKINDGWRIYPGVREWFLKAPETKLCDLSEPWANIPKTPEEILAFYRTIKHKNTINKVLGEINQKYKNLKVILLKGDSLSSEFRITGLDKRVFEIKEEIFELVKKTKKWEEELKKSKKVFNFTIKKQGLTFVKNVYGNTISKIYIDKIIRRYNLIFEHKNLRIIDKPIKYNEVPVGIWKKLPECDMKVFILWSGFKYAIGYFNEIKKDDVIFLDIHTGMDIFKTLIFSKREFKGKKIAIIDKSYCGETIRKAKEIIRKKGGKPFGVALWPKSKLGIKGVSYFFIGDKLFKNNPSMQKQKNLFEKLFIESFK